MVNQSKSRRVCQYPGCGTPLSSYNRNSFCFVHQGGARPDFNMGTKRASPRAKKPSQLRFYEMVLSINPHNSEEFEAFLDKHHFVYRDFKEANPSYSHQQVLEFFDATIGSEGIHRPELFFWRQYSIKEIVENLFGGGDFSLGIEQLNGEMTKYQLSPKLIPDEEGAVHLVQSISDHK